MGSHTIDYALLSVSDKTDLVGFARQLSELGIGLVSTGGTASRLREAGLEVMDIADWTGFPEILDGRVKSTHPVIHAGILARRDSKAHTAALAELGIRPISLVIVNLYPFRQTVSRSDSTLAEAVEQIDIGGPALLRAAAKNYQSVTVVAHPEDYARIGAELASLGRKTRLETRLELARKAFRHTAEYDLAIAGYLDGLDAEADQLPKAVSLDLRCVGKLRYGENPHQRGALYRSSASRGGVASARQHQGKELSFNNLFDLDAAWRLALEFDRPFCAIVKHTNPCGAALADTPAEAFRRALKCDPVSAFGSIIAFNRTVDPATAQQVQELFVEAVVAPGYDRKALAVLASRKNLRVMEVEVSQPPPGQWDLRSISGGFLLQDQDRYYSKREDCRVVTESQPSEAEWEDLLFAWRVCKHVKSNAIVLASEGKTVGIGAGQMSRVDSVRIAAQKAQLPTEGALLASDAFFPFRDGVDLAAENGIRAVIQPGGSIRDQEVIEAANQHGLAMALTGVRHFKH